MRCPKCHYISFESADRCRNCGYDFSLAEPPAPPAHELPLNDRDADPAALVDLSLGQVDGLGEPRVSERSVPFDIDAIPSEGGAAATPVDLPLFKNSSTTREPVAAREPGPARSPAPPPARARVVGRLDETDEDAPLVKASPVPRPPIAVRRATPDAQRLRARYPLAEVPRLDLEPAGAAPTPTPEVVIELDEAGDLPAATPAPGGRRLGAAAIDLLILAGIDIAVLYFTLKLCELPLTRDGVLALPLVPVVVFLLMLNGGYAITFTAAVGQTIGKMAMGLKVVHVTDDEGVDDRPNFGFAILRTAAYAASILPAGLGFLPALVGKDRRALHDRLAETRVVQWGPIVKS